MAQKYLDMNGLTRYHEGLIDYMSEAVGTQGDMSVTDPTNMAYIKNVPDWVRSETKPEYDAEEVGADATGTAHTEVSNHDVSETAHEDIRNLIQEINTQIEESTWDDKYTKEEVDEKDVTTLASAKSYTDTTASSTLAEAKSYADTSSASTLVEAKAYAEGQASDALEDAKEYNDSAYANANLYTDQKIADLINGAPTTLDTLGEIATAMANNANVVEALDEAIGKKADQTELDTHTGNNTIHITADERTAWNQNATDVSNIINGTTPVGDSNKLGGKGASEYALNTQLFSNVEDYRNLDFNTATTTKMYSSMSTPSQAGATNYPINYTGLLIVNGGSVLSQKYVTFNGFVYERTKLNHADYAWTEWKQTATTADLANYLPLSGGILSGNLEVSTTTEEKKAVILSNAKRRVWFEVESDGTCDLWDTAKGKAIFSAKLDGTNTFNGTASGNLPLTGGTVGNGTSYTPVKVNGVADGSYIEFEGNGNRYGRLGFYGESKLGMLDNNSNLYPLLHTGNVGSYALPKSDPSVTGGLTVSRYNNGFSKFHKSHDNGTADYGTIIHDETKDGTKVLLIVQANQNGAFFRDTSGTTHTLLHTGNSAKVATSGSYNDLTDKPTSLPASDVYSWAKASTKPSYTKAEVGLGNVDNTADSAKSVKYANSAGSASSATTASTAVRLARGGDASIPMTFNWSGQSGQPTWLWGGEDGSNMYVYNPANFNVKYANSAGSANTANYAAQGHSLRTHSADGNSHGEAWLLKAQHNVKGNGYFDFVCGDGSVGVQVDRAVSAGSISNQGSAATKDIVMTTSDPGAGAASSYKEGSIICVYE